MSGLNCMTDEAYETLIDLICGLWWNRPSRSDATYYGLFALRATIAAMGKFESSEYETTSFLLELHRRLEFSK